MTTKHEKAVAGLFSSRPAMTLRNIKFCRGSRDLITEEEFKAQLAFIEDQKSAGKVECSEEAPRSGSAAIDVREFVANI